MKILSFNRVKQEELLQKSALARNRRRYQEAYDFLREALRYGEDAAILSRAAGLLNEMGEYSAALQLAAFALTKEKSCEPAQWEMALAFERLWDVDEAIDILLKLEESRFPDVNLALFKCFVKKGQIGEARKHLFRHAHGAELPAELKAVCDRFESAAKTRLTLRDWKWVMHGHFLAHERTDGEFETHVASNGRAPAAFEGRHYIIARPNFRDCARVLLALEGVMEKRGRSYSGVIALGSTALPVALFLARLHSLPLINTTHTGGSPLLVMGGNLEARPAIPRGLQRHDLLILMKSFERDEFHDAVAPPVNLAEVGRWPEPLRPCRTQIIGALGEMIFLPWERSTKTSRSSSSSDINEGAWAPAMDVEEAAGRLWKAYQEIRR